MSVLIGSARIDENGKAHGGKAGDQTGKEVSTQKWYKHSKGWRVFRAKDSDRALMIAQNMAWACENNHIGYDQHQRLTLYNESKPYGYNCNRITNDCETDCSALVRVCCAYAGIELPNFRTTTEPNVLLNSGFFEEMRSSKYTDSDKYLKRGDILCTASQGHTVVVLSNGSKAESEVINPLYVKVTGGTVNIRTAPGVNGTGILGIVKKGTYLTYQGMNKAIEGRDWYLVEYNGRNAWISSKYSELVE